MIINKRKTLLMSQRWWKNTWEHTRESFTLSLRLGDEYKYLFRIDFEKLMIDEILLKWKLNFLLSSLKRNKGEAATHVGAETRRLST